MAFDIVLYNCYAETNRVDKSNYLSNAKTLTGTLRAECSLTTPDVVVELDTVPTYNYAYIAEFGRYYFITGITSVRANLWRISLSVDVLMSYKTEILRFDVITARQEFEYNPDFNDPSLPCEVEPDIQIVDIPSTVFDVTGSLSKKYLITVIGAA